MLSVEIDPVRADVNHNKGTGCLIPAFAAHMLEDAAVCGSCQMFILY